MNGDNTAKFQLCQSFYAGALSFSISSCGGNEVENDNEIYRAFNNLNNFLIALLHTVGETDPN